MATIINIQPMRRTETTNAGVTFNYASDRGYKAYTVTKLAFEKIRNQHSVKLAEHGIDTREIA